MPQATFWLAGPFREWIGRRTIVISWEGSITLRQALERLADEHPKFHTHVMPETSKQEAFNRIAAVILDGGFLSLDAAIPDGATIEVLTPLAGGRDPNRRTRGSEP